MSWIIAKILRTKFSHVAVEVFDGEQIHVYEASIFGIRKIAQSYFKNENRVIFSKTLRVEREKIDSVITFCENFLGAPYGFLALIGIFFRLTFKVKTSIGVDGKKSAVCSELVARVLVLAGVLKFKIKLDFVDPKMLYSMIRSIT